MGVTPRHASRRATIRERRTRLVSALVTLALLLGALPVATLAGLVASATSAEAATVTVPAAQRPQARMINHIGWTAANGTANPQSNDCSRFGIAPDATTSGTASNTGGSGGTAAAARTDGSTAWVSAGTTAYSAHGNNSCSTISGTDVGSVSLSNQSAIGFSPRDVSTFDTGAVFNLGRMVHRNNPVNVVNEWFRGDIGLQFMGMDMTFRWRMDETPNNYSPQSDPRNNDILDFLNQTTDQTFTVGGLVYTLVVEGFTAPNGTNNTCLATLSGAATPVNQFSTVEGTSTYGCLWASAEQVRTVTVVKQAEAPYGLNGATIPASTFTSSSSLAGSPWATGFSLTPTAIGASGTASVTRTYTTGQTVSITETTPTSPWGFTDVVCRDGSGVELPAGYKSGATVTLNETTAPAVTSAAAVPITCTYTNTVRPTATLTLLKSVTSTGQPAPQAVASNWTLTATRNPVAGVATPVSSISGVGQATAGATAAITNQSVAAGTYVLSETASGTNTGGYQQSGAWTCTAGTVSTTDGVTSVTLTQGQNATCTVRNVYQTGSLVLSKTVTGAGYTGGTTKSFTVQYVCTTTDSRTVTGTVTLAPNATNGQPGSAITVSNVPAGSTCTVAETAPSGGLVNSSWIWGTPTTTYSPNPAVVPANGSASAGVTNPTVQQFGSFTIAKAITPRSGVPASGYAGGAARTFAVTYQCTIAGTVTRSGTGVISVGTPLTVTGVPATSVCVVTETAPTTQSGDFVDASYAWDGSSGALTLGAVPANGNVGGTITNYFTRVYASLTVTKTVVGGGYIGTGEPFQVVVTCGSGESQVVRTLTLSSTGSKTASVPAGVACTVVETTPSESLLSAEYAWQAPSYTGLTNGVVSVAANSSATVGVTNTTVIDLGRVSVTKAIAHFGSAVANGTTFAVQVSCGTAGTFAATLTWSGGASSTWTSGLLPVGTSCTVTEDQPTGGLPDASYAWGAVPSAQTVVVPSSLDPVGVTVTNDITRVRAPFTIVKDVQKPDGAPGATIFYGTYSCTYGVGASAETISGTWTAPPGGGAATLSPVASVLLGSSCTVTEADPTNPPDPSYSWTKTVPGATSVTAVTGAQATVSNTLNRSTGSFSVAKGVRGGAAGTAFEDEAFTFAYVCTPQTGDPISGTLTMSAGGSQSVADIPFGSTCAVRETGTADPIDPFRWDGVTFSGGGGELVAGAWTFTTPSSDTPVAVTATNAISARSGSVSVTKAVTGETAGFTGGSDAIFPIGLTCDGVSYGTQDVADGESLVFSGIPLGAACTASESGFSGGLADASFAWASPIVGESVTVDVEGSTPSGTITVTNRIVRVYAPVQLTKEVRIGTYTGVVDPAATYDGSFQCTYSGAGDDETVTGSWSGTDATPTDDAGSLQTLTPAGGEPATRIEVLVGSVCTPTENPLDDPSNDPSFVWADPVVTPVTVTATPEFSTMTVVNTLERTTGDLVVSKLLSGETDGVTSGTVFPVSAVCGYEGVEGTFTGSANVTAGADPVALISDVPAGWTCTVSEGVASNPDGPPLYDASYAWGATTIRVDGVDTVDVVVTADETAQVEVTNGVVRVRSGFEIVKALGAGTPELSDDAQFSGSYQCTYTRDETPGETYTGTWAVDGTGAATLTPDDDGPTTFPIGTSCAVTSEAALGTNEFLPDTSWAWSPADLGQAVTIAPGVTPTVTVTNTATRVFTDLQVTKSFTGSSAALVDGATVDGSWACFYPADATDPGSQVAGGTWTLPASGGSAVLATADAGDDGDSVPAESRCEIRENTPDQANLVNSSYAWTTPAYAPAGSDGASGAVTTVAGQAVGVTVTNSTQRVTGTFTITKDVQLSANATTAASAMAALTYSGTWRCTLDGETDVPQPVTGTWGPVLDGAEFSVPGVLLGSSCEVTAETRPADPVEQDVSFVWLPWTSDGPVSVDSVQTAPVVTVANPVDRVLGSFAVSKTVLDEQGGVPADARFTFEWQCEAENGDLYPDAGPGTFTLASGETWDSPAAVPDDSSCTVIEAGLPTPNHPSFAWSTTNTVLTNGDESGSGTETATFQTGGPSDVVIAEFTNTLTRTPGSYSVSKTSDPPTGSTVLPGDPITYTMTVTPGGAGFVDDVVVTDDLTAVLANATLSTEDLEPSQGSAVFDDATNHIVWSVGTVDAANGPLTLVYTVKVNDEAFGVRLTNVVTATGEYPPQECQGDCSTTHVTPAWTLAKSADPATGSTVLPGQDVTYTLTVTNTSEATVAGAVVTDDLSDVLDHASLAGTLPAGLTLDGSTLTWDVPTILAGGEPASVSYTVTVDDDAIGVTLANVATPSSPGGTCVEESGCSTEHPTPGFTLSKASDPASGSTVVPGDVVTYTLTATNTSDGVVEGATAVDDLTQVLSHADIVGTLPPELALVGSTLTWSIPTLAPGADPASVSYTVRVRAGEDGATLLNVVTTDSPGGSCLGACSTTHVTPAWTLAKSSDPATGATVVPGQQVTYTLTAANTSDAVVRGALATDDLSGLLAHAALVEPLAEGLAFDAESGVLTWTIPEIAAGAPPASVSYTVTVNPDAVGATLTNVVTPQGPGGECVEGDCTTTHYTPVWSLAKTSDPASGRTVDVGSTITYTLTATNESEEAAVLGASAVDDLSDVLDDAAIVGELPAGLTLDGTTLTWAIPTIEPGGEPVSVSYSVRVNDDATGATIRNVVTPATGGSCVESCTTQHPTPAWTIEKSSDPVSGSTVLPGQSVTYTLTATNVSDAVVAGRTAVDDLSDVLDDATLTEPLADGLTFDAETGVLTWAIPEMAAGSAPSTVSYTVTVADGAFGATLRNVVTSPGSSPCVAPDSEGRALPGAVADPELCPTTTEHYTPAWTLQKNSDPATGATVAVGQHITYTLTAANTSEAEITGATAVDDLSKVLANARLVGDLPAGLTLSGTTLTWEIPTMPAGSDPVSVSYTVEVGTAAGVTITNVVTPSGGGGECTNACTTTHEVPPTVSPSPSPSASASAKPLPGTGAAVGGAAGIALLLLLAGGGAVLASRRRRTERD
ncbi:DUF5979 domain-containing protein [Miniimonas sp. S16]|uniref:DUF7927 domain-containing protein n=1 Tax=Miniimonas sp. S16 TaxID=2171623 RepID=UPI000D52A621|nr:DUF5979 domain-containing protein [Miniimonas sp. S16]